MPEEQRPDFTCGDSDLDEFYHTDSVLGSRELISATYIAKNDDTILGFFSLSNDAIRVSDCSGRSARERVKKKIPKRKRYSSSPAVKIGRLGVNKDLHGKGSGTQILDYLKGWFTFGNKTGCRFLVVDAYNEENVIKFYEKNGFRFLNMEKKGKKEETRIMYFDLIHVLRTHHEINSTAESFAGT